MAARLAILTLLAALLLPTPAGARGDTLLVGPGGAYATLAEALAQAAPGATLELLPGVQTGQWTIDQPLRLVGRPGAILNGAGQGTLLRIAAADVTVEGLQLRNSGRSLLDDDAAILVTGSRAVIRNNRLEDIHHAIYVMDGAAGTLIADNVIQGRAALIREDRGNGIHLWDAPGTQVERNTVRDVRDGIYVGFAPASAFRGNSFERVRYGIHFMYADDNSFEDNRFAESEAGAALMYSSRITLRRNVFTRSRSSRAYGLLLQECHDVTAQDNVFADNSRALFVNLTYDSRFEHNLFLANNLAVQIYAGSTNNHFGGNDFVGNLELVMLDQPGSNSWAGNYWDGYVGLDMDEDGYGERAFATGEPLGLLLSDYPQLKLFQHSPGVQALGLAERAFPVLELPEIRDERPALRPVAQATGRLPVLSQTSTGPNLGLALLSLCGLALVSALACAALGRQTLRKDPHDRVRTDLKALRRHPGRRRPLP